LLCTYYVLLITEHANEVLWAKHAADSFKCPWKKSGKQGLQISTGPVKPHGRHNELQDDVDNTSSCKWLLC